jgi:hypothetical protein
MEVFMKMCCILLALCFAIVTGRVECNSHEEHGHHHGHHNNHGHGHNDHDHAYKFSIHQKDYRFSTVFEMDSHAKPHGTVVKSKLRWLKPLRDSYDVYDKDGEWVATGISRVFCLGLFRAWGAEFDVYDTNGNVIGVIDGQVVTAESAKYSIYNKSGQRVGIAYLDLTNAGIAIVHPEKTNHIIARLTRNFVRDQVDHWDVVVYDTDAIDSAIIKVFAGFAVDYQEYFKADL